jgi:cellobiose phosphorylase
MRNRTAPTAALPTGGVPSITVPPVPDTAVTPHLLPLAAQNGFGLVTLRNGSPLTVQLLPTGAIFAFRHGGTLLNQVLPGPAEDGLLRLLLREYATPDSATAANHPGVIQRATTLVGAGLGFSSTEKSATWISGEPDPTSPTGRISTSTTLELHDSLPAWRWRVRLHNPTAKARRVDVLHAQDIGLGDEAAVRNNEAYHSQYLDWLPVADDRLGWTLLVRQNQPTSAGRHPWLGFACAAGAEAYCTDGWQFFGGDHRLTGEPVVAHRPSLPSRRSQYECALAGLQSGRFTLEPGASIEVVFLARYLDDHPAASAAADVEELRPLAQTPAQPAVPAGVPRTGATSVFHTAPWWHGDEPTEADLTEWFPGEHRHVERAEDQRPLAFFCDHDTHVVTRTKEAIVDRPHGHILRSGEPGWNDARQFSFTAFAAGIFAAQSYLGNASIARLLPVVRNALGLGRAAGQRVFVRLGGRWRQLGVPSAFALRPAELRWIYRCGERRIEARAWASATLPASWLELRVIAGAPCEFLVTHALALGANEFDFAAEARLHLNDGWAALTPGRDSLVGEKQPDLRFALGIGDPSHLAVLGGDELIYDDGRRRGGPYLALRTFAVESFAVMQAGTTEGDAALASVIAHARAEYVAGAAPAQPLACPLRLSSAHDPGLARVNEFVPWLNHNAGIHFSAPHGLEQYGGAAWGVRDVCQGSLEWLLTLGRTEVARRMLLTLFGQQYAAATPETAALDGTWPQWFMFPPFAFIQQAHSHGDVCFWPVKALCDYVEASNDFGLLDTAVGYTDPQRFAPVGPEEPLWDHCERVLQHVVTRFAPGSALVNYGDGDWDDTLQPADPSLRTRMISAWTVALAFHTLRQFATVCRRADAEDRASRIEGLLQRMRSNFATHLMPDGVVAGFVITEAGRVLRPLLHPRDQMTGIRYRLLPMTRSLLAELFTPSEAKQHLEIIERELRYPDGVRLMSEPARYRGGCETLFKRADTAANVGREIGLQYVHAHLRYAEALAKVGDADGLWRALQAVNPIGLTAVVPNAAPRQSNVYFSSSDADFGDRYEAAKRWSELKAGHVAVRGGWRLYSSGPGLFLHTIRASLLGLRESFGDVVFDPVLPRVLDGLVASVQLCGVAVEIQYHVRTRTFAPSAVSVNGEPVTANEEPNPYRTGGLRVTGRELASRLLRTANRIEIEL